MTHCEDTFRDDAFSPDDTVVLVSFLHLIRNNSGIFDDLIPLFPNSHAMGSCKTNRRTGAVGSPSELVGGWCPGHVLMASGSCDAGVPVMF